MRVIKLISIVIGFTHMSLLEDRLQNLSWPEKKKSLFSERKDWWNVARLKIRGEAEGFSIYSEGYRDAADKLVEYAKTDQTSIDSLIFPILFLYRHYIELALKEIILAATLYLGKQHKSIKSHNLTQLWQRVKELISEVELDIPIDEMIAIENQISQFDMLDNSSETFRYPVDKQGNVFKKLSDYVNVENVREIVDGLHTWCFGLVCVLGEYEDAI
ncbi:hypothetical protein EDS67_18675 [candidate division KSB1 bacterium]|nr:MAG: hypothetical protein EDS67_18675 [candidate division KSB1 bacterium]MBC6950855.1 hypothetical protein [candidate division KSB1 bacterium]MCE7944526.1 hypothetical protein [Chlorobi bacterium CHB1]